MGFTITIVRSAQKALGELSGGDYTRTKEAIRKLAEDPRPPGSLKLSGRPGWRIRSGNYRVIYEVNDAEKKVTILHIGHRREVYRS